MVLEPHASAWSWHSLKKNTVFALGLIVFLITLINPAHASASTPTEAFDNPIIFQRADPSVYKHTDGYYYLTYSVPEYNRIALRRAKTVQGLATAKEQIIWTKHDSGEMSANIWAPWIDYNNGTWYVYFAAAQQGSPFNHRIYALSNSAANPVTGSGWTERGKITMNWESFSIDTTTFVHAGKRYIVWAQKDPNVEGNSNLYIAELDGPLAIKGKQVRLSQPEYDWEKVGFWVNEAPAVMVRNGKVFITYSGSATDANYNMGLLSAPATADLLDPSVWTKSPVPVFKSSERNGVYGTGSNTFTTDKNGTVLNIYNARNYKGIIGDPLYDPNRSIYVQPVHWDANGNPIFGAPKGADRPVTLVNRNSTKCLSVEGAKLEDGTPVEQSTCDRNNAQRWHLIKRSKGFYEVLSVNSGKVLTAQTKTGSSAVTQETWQDLHAQHWQMLSGSSSWFRLVNRATGQVLDVPGCKVGDGAEVGQSMWLKNSCQYWLAVP
jgi:GH43 family beta-xylosidase